MANQRKFGNSALVISITLNLILVLILIVPNNLETKYEKLRKEKTEVDKIWEELFQKQQERFQRQLDTHEENTLKVSDQLFVKKKDYPFLYSSKGVTRDFNIRLYGDKGPTYTVVFEKGGTVMGTNSNRDTWTFTSPRGATIYLDRNHRVIEIKGIVYKIRY